MNYQYIKTAEKNDYKLNAFFYCKLDLMLRGGMERLFVKIWYFCVIAS